MELRGRRRYFLVPAPPALSAMLYALLFERIWPLIAVLVLLQFVWIALWSWRRSILTRRMVWAGFGSLVLLPALSAAIQTDREQVVHRIEALVDAIQQREIGQVADALAPELQAEHLSRDELVERLHERLHTYRVSDARAYGFVVSFAADGTAITEFNAICRVRGPELLYEWLPTRWRLRLRRDGSQWLISHIERLPSAGAGLGNLRELTG